MRPAWFRHDSTVPKSSLSSFDPLFCDVALYRRRAVHTKTPSWAAHGESKSLILDILDWQLDSLELPELSQMLRFY